MSEKNIDVRFRFIDSFTSGFKKSISALTSGTKDAERAWKQVGKVGDSIAATGTKLTASVTAPLAVMAATSVSEFGDVDKEMRLVASTMGEAKWATGDLTSAMKEAASNSTFGMQDAADACLNFARQGFNAKESADMIGGAMALAAGTATDLSTVTAGLGTTMKIFGLSSESATEVSDIFATAQASANTSTTDLIESMSVAGPMAASVGWTVSDLATYTAQFGEAGFTGSEGANALKTGLARIADPAKDGAEWMEKLGLNLFDSSGNMKSALEVQEQLHDSFSGLSDQEKLSASSAIFGKEQMEKWLKVIEQSPETFKQLSSSIENSSGSAQSMSDALMSGVGGSIERLKSTFDVFKYNVGEQIGPALQPFIDKLTELIQAFNDMDPAQQQQVIRWAAIAAAIGPVIMIFGKGVSTVAKVGGFINRLAVAGSRLGGVFTTAGAGGKIFGGVLSAITSPAGVVIGVLAGVAAAAFLVWKNWDKIKSAMSKVGSFPAVKALVNVFKGLWNVIKGIGKIIGGFFSGFAKGIKKTANASGLLKGIRKGFSAIGKALTPVMKVLSKVFNLIAKGFQKAAPYVKKFGTIVGQVCGKIATFLFNVLGKAFEVVGKVIAVKIDMIVGFVKGLLTGIQPIVDGVKKIFNGLVDFITGVFTGNWSKAWDGVVSVFKGIFETITGIAKSVINGVSGAINAVINAINGIGFTIPDWVPGIGGKSFSINIPTIPQLAKGTENWPGGLAQINERGGEIVDIPRGSRVYPHDQSIEMARRQGNTTINIPKLADQIVVREDADIDRIGDMLVRKIKQASGNMGNVLPAGG